MPFQSNLNNLVGASVLGCVVCVATFYVIEHFRQDRRRHMMAQDLARLDTELSVLKKQFEALLTERFYGCPNPRIHLGNYPQNRLPLLLNNIDLSVGTKPKQKSVRVVRKNSVNKNNEAKRDVINSTTASSVVTDDYLSAAEIDSDDLEFYDVSDEEIEPEIEDSLRLSEIDAELDSSDVNVIKKNLAKLTNLSEEHPENPEYLWRIGKAYYRLFEATSDVKEKQQHIALGVEACTKALSLEPKLADVHKWMAVLVGSRSDFQPMKEKILDGHLFKQHVDAAIALKPNDPPLHHMLGRFALEIASLKWYERKVASALFSEPPNCTYDEALQHFLRADELSKQPWKENKLCVAKCKIQLNDIEDAVRWLKAAQVIPTKLGDEDKKTQQEIEKLLEKYCPNS